MAFVRPTLAELRTRIQQDFVSQLELGGAVLRRAVVRIFSRVLAGAVHMLHGHVEYVEKQIQPDTADRENLIRIAALYGITLKAAEFASGNVTFTGANGSVIPTGTTLLRSDAAEYLTEAEATIASGTATVAVSAVVAGEVGNTDADAPLSLEGPIAGVDNTATVAAGGLSNGSDEESTDALLERLLARLRNPPHGGAEADYLAWAKEVPGVTRAWVYPEELGAGTVTVRFVRDDDASPIPDAGEVTAVQEYIDELRPVTATLTVVAPVDTPLDVELSITPDTADTRAAVEAELADMLRRDAEPGAPILLSAIQTAVGVAAGVTDYTVTDPLGDVTHTTGQLATLGTVTFT